jgi:hypothetical protein
MGGFLPIFIHAAIIKRVDMEQLSLFLTTPACKHVENKRVKARIYVANRKRAEKGYVWKEDPANSGNSPYAIYQPLTRGKT